MKSFLRAAAFMAAFVAAPADARDHSAYLGVEAGPMWAQDSRVRLVAQFNGMTFVSSPKVRHRVSFDGDLIAGYDFGIFRAEVEGAQKWAKHNESCDGGTCVDAHGHSRARSLMGNALIDVGKNDGVNVYAGGGVGFAWLRQKFAVNGVPGSSKIGDKGLAWQLIAGARASVTRRFDVGLKYRYFRSSKIADDFADGGASLSVRSNFHSHSVLASLIYNFADAGDRRAPPARG
jgi:OOP family OmpA-OmpF porin